MVTASIVRAIDFIVLSFSLIVLISLIGYARPLVIAPLDDFHTSNTSVLFSFEKGTAVLLDDNTDFSSPQRIEMSNEKIITLEPDTYYWKVEGVESSEVRQLTILSTVALGVRETSEAYEIINTGSVPLDVAIYSNGTLKENVTLMVSERTNVSGEMFVGREHA